jgi:3-carboxy-cis,cis-muconate cycloisomerase
LPGADLVASDLAAISGSLADLARRHRDTHGRAQLSAACGADHLGFKIAAFSAIERHRCGSPSFPRVLVGEFAGAVGTSRRCQQPRDQAALMKAAWVVSPISRHSHRDRIAEVGCFLGLVTERWRSCDRRQADDAN